MSQLLVCLLTLLISLSSPAMERNAGFRDSSLAAKAGIGVTGKIGEDALKALDEADPIW